MTGEDCGGRARTAEDGRGLQKTGEDCRYDSGVTDTPRTVQSPS